MGWLDESEKHLLIVSEKILGCFGLDVGFVHRPLHLSLDVLCMLLRLSSDPEGSQIENGRFMTLDYHTWQNSDEHMNTIL